MKVKIDKNSGKGKIHEIYFHSLISNLSTIHPDQKQKYYEWKPLFLPAELEEYGYKAAHLVKHLRHNLFDGREVKSIIDTTLGVDGETQKDNASDFVIEFTDGSKIGLSLKSSSDGVNTGVGNPGLSTIEKYTKVVSGKHRELARAELGVHFPATATVTTQVLKQMIKDDKRLATFADSLTKKVLRSVAMDQVMGLRVLDLSRFEEFLRQVIFRTNAKFPVYLVETNKNSKTGEIVTTHKALHEVEHLFKDMTKYLCHNDNAATIYFDHIDFGLIASLRFKFTNRFGSSIKGFVTHLDGAYVQT